MEHLQAPWLKEQRGSRALACALAILVHPLHITYLAKSHLFPIKAIRAPPVSIFDGRAAMKLTFLATGVELAIPRRTPGWLPPASCELHTLCVCGNFFATVLIVIICCLNNKLPYTSAVCVGLIVDCPRSTIADAELSSNGCGDFLSY